MGKAPRTPMPSHRDLPYPATAPRHGQYPARLPPSPDDDRHSSATWTQESDEKLLQARQKGLNWQPIASQHFPNKTANACRKRFERLMQQKNAADSWDSMKTASLAKAYMETRQQIWAPLAEKLGEKWTTVEQKVSKFACIILTECLHTFTVYGEGPEDSFRPSSLPNTSSRAPRVPPSRRRLPARLQAQLPPLKVPLTRLGCLSLHQRQRS